MDAADKARFIAREHFSSLLDSLRQHGYRCVGPKVQEGAIVYDELGDVSELPRGYSDEQAPGRYRLHQQDHSRYFAWANGPQAIKPHTFSPKESLWRVTRDEQGALAFEAATTAPDKVALLGVRNCDLAAYALQKKHFVEGQIKDNAFSKRADKLLLIAVNCTHAAATCFCVSTGDGPEVKQDSDIILSELDDGFVVQAGSEQGAAIIEPMTLPFASERQLFDAAKNIDGARQQQRTIDPERVRDVLKESLNSNRWQQIAERCLSCGNCTAVCPSCFCHRQNDEPSLTEPTSEHYREWDSCFSESHSYLHGHPLHQETAHRYRQWLTHKFSSWYEQYGRSGCTGCGRCISWCPVGIDVTEEVNAFCQDGATSSASSEKGEA